MCLRESYVPQGRKETMCRRGDTISILKATELNSFFIVSDIYYYTRSIEDTLIPEILILISS